MVLGRERSGYGGHRRASEVLGGRRGSHPPAPADPGVTISRHRALVILTTRSRAPCPVGEEPGVLARPSAWLRAVRCRKPTSIAGKHGRSQRRCFRTPHPRCTASDKPYTAPVPTAPLESDHRDSNCGSPCEGKFVIVTFSPIAGANALNMAGPQWVYAIFMDDLYCPHESRTIPPRRRCARPTSLFTAAKSAPAGAAGHPGQGGEC